MKTINEFDFFIIIYLLFFIFIEGVLFIKAQSFYPRRAGGRLHFQIC